VERARAPGVACRVLSRDAERDERLGGRLEWALAVDGDEAADEMQPVPVTVARRG
jgi:hypothetical protein